jgi:hypothetical protein
MKQMTFNRWTLALAACGLVSLASAARADEKPSAVQTALSNTTISGYVSASANVGLTDSYATSPAASIPFQPASKENGFNLDVVKLVIAKPEDSTPWASGYEVDLLFGPDAVGYNTSVNTTAASDFGIKQAFVTLHTPVGNGIDWKLGVFDSPLGYEVYDTDSNPNYTHSWGYYLEPTELTGLQASYKVNDQWSLSAGLADTSSAGINNRNSDEGLPDSVGHEAYFADVTYTAPSSWGWAAGSSVFVGVLYGSVDTVANGVTGGYMGGNQVNYYGGVTLNTPWKQVTGGLAFDYVRNFGGGTESPATLDEDVVAIGLYGTYKATDKLSFDARGEYVEADYYTSDSYTKSANLVELTGTVEYDLWANVQSRVELRWDQDLSTSSGELFAAGQRDSVGLYANIIYKF